MTVATPRAAGKALQFDEAAMLRAFDEWGANCGPAALAAICGMTLEEVRTHIPGFEQKRYTNPTMMYAALASIGADVSKCRSWPKWGLSRIQWVGPWMEPGMPQHARYRHTHWVGVRGGPSGSVDIFDVNCMNDGGWVPHRTWDERVVPWILRHAEPLATGQWHATHLIEVRR